jgi:hypothetical protein
MKKLLLLLPLLLVSCASVFTTKKYGLQLVSPVSNARVRVNDSVYTLPTTIEVERSRKNIAVQLITDSVTTPITIKSKLSPAFLYGNLALVSMAPVGYVVDLTNQKRFYYGYKVVLDPADSIARRKNGFKDYMARKHEVEKRAVKFSLSIPWLNAFCFQPEGEGVRNGGGFLGISAGLEYYYKKNRFLKFQSTAMINFLVPFPAPYINDGQPEDFTSAIFTLTDNFKPGRYTFGYGLSYSVNYWSYHSGDDYMPGDKRSTSQTNRSVGLALSSYFQVTEAFFIGVLYNPSFYTIDPVGEFSYQHTLSLDLMWKIKLFD